MKWTQALYAFSSATTLPDLLKRCDTYVMHHSARYQVDESHNHIHSRHVLHYAKEIIKRRGATPYEILLSSLGSMLHDVPDTKYVDHPSYVLEQALDFILPASYQDTVGADLALMIPLVSFSKTVSKDPLSDRLLFSLPQELGDFPHLESYHIIREADLLSSYNTKRTLLYRMHKSNFTKSPQEVLSEARELYTERMAKLRSSELFLLPEAERRLARPLEHLSLTAWATSPSSFDTWEDMLAHFNLDPVERWEKTLEDVDALFRHA